MVIVKMTCTRCKREIGVSVEVEDYLKWNQGMLIQKAMPYLSPDERELLISGICGPCFDQLFREEE
jgi:hypothetical protein